MLLLLLLLLFRALALRQRIGRRANARNVSFFTLYGGQFTFSTQLLTLNNPVVVLSVDQFVEHGGGPLERQKQDSHVCRKTGTLSLIFKKFRVVTTHKRRSLRNCDKGMEILACDGCEDEYNK